MIEASCIHANRSNNYCLRRDPRLKKTSPTNKRLDYAPELFFCDTSLKNECSCSVSFHTSMNDFFLSYVSSASVCGRLQF